MLLAGRVPELPFHKYNYCGIGTSHPPLGGTNESVRWAVKGERQCGVVWEGGVRVEYELS